MESGRFKSNPLLIKGGGLEGIQEDLDLLKSGTVSFFLSLVEQGAGADGLGVGFGA